MGTPRYENERLVAHFLFGSKLSLIILVGGTQERPLFVSDCFGVTGIHPEFTLSTKTLVKMW